MIPGYVTTSVAQKTKPPLPLSHGGLDLLYLFPQAIWSEAFPTLDATRQIKKWSDPYAYQTVDEDFPDLVTGLPTVGYISYRIDAKSNSVKLFTFRMTAKDAVSVNVQSPKDTRPSFPSEVPFPCREIDPVTETLAVGFGGIEIRNISLYSQAQTIGDREGFTQADRDLLNQILTFVKK